MTIDKSLYEQMRECFDDLKMKVETSIHILNNYMLSIDYVMKDALERIKKLENISENKK
jgi:hypothetical protein